VATPDPTPQTRWRCALCGNLTRFDRTVVRRAVEFVHVDLAGEPQVDDTEVLAESVEEVRCRWCGSLDIELVPRPDGTVADDSAVSTGSTGSVEPVEDEPA
jgi:hypothetical protein